MNRFVTVEELVEGTRFEVGTIVAAIRSLQFPPSWVSVQTGQVLLDERAAHLLGLAEVPAGDGPPDLRLVRYAAGMETARRQAMLYALSDPDESRSNVDHLKFLGEIIKWTVPDGPAVSGPQLPGSNAYPGSV